MVSVCCTSLKTSNGIFALQMYMWCQITQAGARVYTTKGFGSSGTLQGKGYNNGDVDELGDGGKEETTAAANVIRANINGFKSQSEPLRHDSSR